MRPDYTNHTIRNTIHLFSELAECSDIIHLLQLMKEVIGCFPKANIKSSCEMVLRLMSLNNLVSTLQSVSHMEMLVEYYMLMKGLLT